MVATSSTRSAQSYREVHALRYGLEVVGRDAESGAVTCTVCLFCRHFGREERPGKKRKSAATVKHFRLPFRTDQYLQHLTLQHPTQWSKYKQSSDEIKRDYFPTDLTRPEPGKKKIVNEKDVVEAATAAKDSPVEKHCWFLIPKRIVEVVVPLTALVGERRWQPLNFRACEVVELSRAQTEGVHGDAGQEKEMYYQIAIFNRMEMDIAVDSLAVGMSPRQVAWHLAALTRRTTGAGGAAPVFPLLKVEDIRELARLTVSTSMQLTGQLLSRSWTFGLVLREVTMAPKAPHAAFLDVRVVVYANGKLRDVHIVALPLFERHKALTLAHSIESVLDAALPLWRIRVLGLTHNGHIIGETNSMPADQCVFPVLSTSPSVHRTAEVLALLETSIQTSTRALPNRELHKTWGACCQVSLALSTFYESLLGGDFLSALHALIAYIRREPALLREMGPPPSVLTKDNAGIDNLNASVDLHTDPELVTMGLDTQWITDKRVRLRKHLEQQLSSSTPAIYSGTTTLVNDVWWVVFFVVHWVATRANEAFEKLRSPRVSRSKQIQVIAAMSTELIATFTIQRGQLAESREIPLISRQNKFSVLKSNVHEFIDDQGIFVSNVAAKLEPAALDAVLENLAISLVDLAESLTDLNDILPESGESARLLPPVLPHELAQLNGREFTALLRRYCGQLNAFYSDEELDTLEQEHQALCRAATRETELKTSLAKCNGESPFTESWELTKSKFPLLQGFAGGLASAYTGRDVGCKKSLISFSIDACRETDIEDGGMGLSAIDFGLETTLHAWQFDALSRLSEACESTEAIAT